jgi:hypothetical protein
MVSGTEHNSPGEVSSAERRRKLFVTCYLPFPGIFHSQILNVIKTPMLHEDVAFQLHTRLGPKEFLKSSGGIQPGKPC